MEKLRNEIDSFIATRNWQKFHSPKNLAMALTVETAELLEIFQWMSESESDALDESSSTKAAEEIADIQIYLLQIATRLGVDIEDAVAAKLVKNAEKYPAA